QADRLLGPEQLTAGDAKDDAVADLPGGAGDGYSYGIAHKFISWVGALWLKDSVGLRAALHRHRLLQVLVDRGEELLGALPRLIGAHEQGEVLCHVPAFDRLDADALERLREGAHLRRVIHAAPRRQATGPGEDGGDRVGGRGLALLVQAV